MEIKFKKTYKESYMVLEGNYQLKQYEEKMLRENQIRSLLSFYTMQLDGTLQFWHDISGKVSLREYLEKEPLTFEVLDRIITYSIAALEELSTYLISQKRVLVHPDTVYINRQGLFHIFLCYYPGEELEKPFFSDVMEYVISIVDHTNEPLTMLCYELYEMSLQEGNTLYEMRDYLQKKIEPQESETEEEECYMEEIPLIEKKEEMEGPEEMENKWDSLVQNVKKRGQKIAEIITGWSEEENETQP